MESIDGICVSEDVGGQRTRSIEGWRRMTWLNELWNVIVDTVDQDSCVVSAFLFLSDNFLCILIVHMWKF